MILELEYREAVEQAIREGKTEVKYKGFLFVMSYTTDEEWKTDRYATHDQPQEQSCRTTYSIESVHVYKVNGNEELVGQFDSELYEIENNLNSEGFVPAS